MPFSVHDNVDHPVSLYAATKKANELMAHTYSHLYGLPTTGLRFFTVYGPWGRPDMALFMFTKAILAGRPIEVFNHGQMRRDFTYVDDIVEGVRARARPPCRARSGLVAATHPDPAPAARPTGIYNIGNHSPVELLHFIADARAGARAQGGQGLLPMQPGDVPATYADVEELTRATGFTPDDLDRGRHRALRALVPRRVAAARRVNDQAAAVGDDLRPVLGAVLAEPDAVTRRRQPRCRPGGHRGRSRRSRRPHVDPA